MKVAENGINNVEPLGSASRVCNFLLW